MDSEELQLFFIPGPGMGHIVPAVELGKLILTRESRFSITYLLINLPANDTQFQKYTESFQLDSNQRLQFLNLPEPQTNSNPTQELNKKPFPVIAAEFIERHRLQVRNAFDSRSGVVAGLIIDAFCVSMIDVAEEFGTPTYIFFTSGAAFLSLQLHFQALNDDHNQDITEYKDSTVELLIPGFVNPVPAKVLPSVMLDTNGGSVLVLSIIRRFREARGILINTYQELESGAIESLLSNCRVNIPPVYPVGPIVNSKLEHDDDIVNWLDNQPNSSVVFLCFGSQGSFNEAQIKEITMALERSRHRFLWSMRLPLLSPNEFLPHGFLERTVGVGKVIGWAPQTTVLSHPAIGGFVSHCGWNSILESLWYGVPIAAWPKYAEQQVNAFEMVVELGMAVDIKMDYRDEKSENLVVSEEIERGINQLMVEKDSEDIRKKVTDFKDKCPRALMEGGSSHKFLGYLILDILQNAPTLPCRRPVWPIV